jgi:hypothetical protein
MAIEIGPIRKPFIYLEGTPIYNTDYDATDITGQVPFAGRVDHAKEKPATSTLTIGGVTAYNQEDILTFNGNVRIVIDTNVGNEILTKPQYQTKLVDQRDQETIFEGSNDDTSGLLSNKYAETWFTINGKDPVRTKGYLYKYLDTSDQAVKNDEGLPNDWSGLGFLLGTAQTGSDLITLKAVTYYQGKKSRIAIAKFKIARPTKGTASLEVGNGVPIAK